MIRSPCLRPAVLSLLVCGRLAATEVEVTFEGEVTQSLLPGIARGQPVDGRLVYDTSVPGAPTPDGFYGHPAVTSFEVRVGCLEYAMTAGPGEVLLFESSPAWGAMAFRTPPGSLAGASQGDLRPGVFGLQLIPKLRDFFPSQTLRLLPVEYSLSDFSDEPVAEDMVLQFQTADAGDTQEVGVVFAKLEGRPLSTTSKTSVRFIQLEDIVAGGDGSGTAPPGNTGVDPTTGEFTTEYIQDRIFVVPDTNPLPVPASPYIDSVFTLKGKVHTSVDGCNGCFITYTTQSGVQLWLSDVEESDSTFNFILKNRNGGVSASGIYVGGAGGGEYFTTSIGLHASAGITFDLDAIRARYGDAAVGCFSAYWGMDSCLSGNVRLMAMVSNDAQGVMAIQLAPFTAYQGAPVSLPIPPSAQYLTLASSSVDGNDSCDHGTFARPIIAPDPCPQHTAGWLWRVTPSRVAPGGEAISVYGESLSLTDFIFGGHYTIRIGGVDLPQQVILSDELAVGVTPPLSPGVYDVELVWNSPFQGGIHQRLPRALEVAPPPVISSVAPNLVLYDRRTPARFVGQNLRPDMEVVVANSADGSEAIAHQELISPELITGSVPPVDPHNSVSGSDVFIIDQGRIRQFPVGLLWVERGIGKVAPNLVPTTGGSIVTITGIGLEPGMTFRIGGKPLLDVEVIESGLARGRTPPLPAGLHAVELLDADGLSLEELPGMVEALSGSSPQIISATPYTVSTRGGDILRIATDTWHGGATPRVDGVALGNIDATEPEVLRGETPPLSAGLHAVELVGSDGTVLSRVEHAIEAVEPAAIQITSVTPLEVTVNGGTPVTFTGTGFEPGLAPRLGGLPLTQVEVLDLQHLRGLSPALPEGPHFASLTDGNVEKARLEDAVSALPILLPVPPAVSRPPAQRFASGSDPIEISATGLPPGSVLRVGGVPVTPTAPTNACGLAGGNGGGGGLQAQAGLATLEGIVPDLPAGRYAVDVYLPGQGIVATLDASVEVVAQGAPPTASHVVSTDVLADGSTRLHIFGSGFAPATRFVLGGKPISDIVVSSSRLAIGHAPALGAGEELGPRTLELQDPRGNTSLAAAVVYVSPPITGGIQFVRGDANQSGGVDISDAITILGYLFLGSPKSLACLETADMDDGGEVDITDAIQLLGHLFLGGPAPRAPYPACGSVPGGATADCESFEPCGAGGGRGGGGAANLRANVFVLAEERTSPGEPIVRDLSPLTGEIVIDDPPGGLDLEPGDIVAGYVPATSAAIHEGLTYLAELMGEGSRSCLATAPTDRTYVARPAALAEVFNDANIQVEMPNSAADVRIPSDLVKATGNTLCDLAEEAGGAGASGDDGSVENGGEQGGGAGFFQPLIDVELPPMEVLSFNDGPNYVHAGFHRLKVKYAAADASLGVGFKGFKATSVSYFSGVLLDTETIVYADAHFEAHRREEKKVLSLRKDHVVVVYGVPIHFAATGDLYAGVELDAQVNLYASAGAKAHFKAGVGIRYDGSSTENLSGVDAPTVSEIPGAQEFDLNGDVAVKGYVRPETHFFAGILFRGLTADLGMRSEAFVRLHAAGETSPVPCFDWGVDAGMNMVLIPEIQLFGKDLYDRTLGLFNIDEPNLIGGRYGCKKPPVPSVSYYLVPKGGDRYDVHLDASASYDPDGGPLRFRWDFDADGQCDRATLGDPRTVVEMDHVCPPFDVRPFDICNRGRGMILRVTDDEDVSVEHRFSVVLR